MALLWHLLLRQLGWGFGLLHVDHLGEIDVYSYRLRTGCERYLLTLGARGGRHDDIVFSSPGLEDRQEDDEDMVIEVVEGELLELKARRDQYGEVYHEDLFLISFS